MIGQWLILCLYLQRLQGKAWELKIGDPLISGTYAIGGDSERQGLPAFGCHVTGGHDNANKVKFGRLYSPSTSYMDDDVKLEREQKRFLGMLSGMEGLNYKNRLSCFPGAVEAVG